MSLSDYSLSFKNLICKLKVPSRQTVRYFLYYIQNPSRSKQQKDFDINLFYLKIVWYILAAIFLTNGRL